MSNAFVQEPGDLLSILAYKAAPGVFDISSRLDHVSIRDQIIRARMLIKDLVFAKQLAPGSDEILIIGAGVAGISAGLAAAELSVNATIVDVNNVPFALQAKVNTRYVGPYMYEWPNEFFNSQIFPATNSTLQSWKSSTKYTLPFKAKKPIPASELASAWQLWLREGFSNGDFNALKLFLNAQTYIGPLKQAIHLFVKNRSLIINIPAICEKWPKSGAGHLSVRPKFIILAAGMGKEDTQLLEGNVFKGVSFWEDDKLKSINTNNSRIAIFGGGDGALQDFLRATLNFNHPLEYINRISPICFSGSRSRYMRELISLEQQHRLDHTWSSRKDKDQYKKIDYPCKEIARKLARYRTVRKEVLRHLRLSSGEVYLFNRDDHFNKAYLLNRFLVHLLEQCKIKESPNGKILKRKIRFRICNLHVAKNLVVSANGDFHLTFPPSLDVPYLYHLVIVRYGIDPTTIPYSRIGFKDNAKANRTTLAHIYQPLA